MCALLCFIIVIFTGCGGTSEIELPKDVRAISTEWQDDQLLYATDNGLFAYFPLNGRTENLMSDNTFKGNITSLDCDLSPDKSQIIVIKTIGYYDNDVEIRNLETDKSVLHLDLDKYREGVGVYRPRVEQVEWFDNENILFSNKFRLFLINTKTGEEVQITEECAPVTTKADPETVAPYLSWAINVKKIGDKLYYNSKRQLDNFVLGSIYVGNKTGENELIKNAKLLLVVDDKRFVYLKESQPDVMETYLYDIPTGVSSLITAERCLRGGIFRTNEGNLVFMTGEMTGGIYQGVVYNPDTKQSQVFDIYNGEKDFPDEDIDRRQFIRFMGAFEQDEECVFMFGVENYSKSKEEYVGEYFAYSTKSKKLIKVDDYRDTFMVYMNICPSGDYIVVTKYKSLGDDDFLFDVLKSDNLLNRLK